MGLPGFDVILGVAAPAVELLIDPAGVALFQIGGDEARVRSLRADLDAGDDALDPAPTRGPIVKLLESSGFTIPGRGLVERLRRRFQALDMPAQRRGGRDAEDVVEPVGATEVENLGSAIVAVAAHQNFGPGPIGADRAQQAAQKALDLLAAGPLGGTQHRGDEAAFAIKNDNGLKAIFIVVRVEQTQLLAAVNRIERVVDIQHDPLGNLAIGLAIKVDHGATHA